MKRMLIKNLMLLFAAVMAFSLAFNYVVQLNRLQDDIVEESKDVFAQVNRILKQNEYELRDVEQSFSENCIQNAKIAAYFIDGHPYIIDSVKDLIDMAKFLGVDEIHIFNEDGVIFSGTEPKYYNYSFKSGAQMAFFAPMLKDKSLELCQDLQPNTAEGKMMMYSAVWCESGKYIVQIGVEPWHIIEYTHQNALANVFSSISVDPNYDLYAVDVVKGVILGSTRENAVGKSLLNIGIGGVDIIEFNKGFVAQINGEKSFCYFTESDNILLGRSCSMDFIYQQVREHLFLMTLYFLFMIAVLITGVIIYINRNIIYSIAQINQRLNHIIDGDLDERVWVRNTPEFYELSRHINSMIRSILATTDRISLVLDSIEKPIGIYEYSNNMARVRVTRKTAKILGIEHRDKQKLLSNWRTFESYLEEVKRSPYEKDGNVYCLVGEQTRYISIDTVEMDGSIFGIVMDATDDIREKLRIEHERDYDLLTGIYNRRAFAGIVNELLANSHSIGHSAMIMIDADNLKAVNDVFGHEKGDNYLVRVSDFLKMFVSDNCIAARYGGDEFVMFIYGLKSHEQLLNMIENIKRRRDEFFADNAYISEIPIGISLGWAICRENETNFEDLLKRADDGMYIEKRSRKKQ